MMAKSNWVTRAFSFLETSGEQSLLKMVALLRFVFVVFMVIYLAACLFSISSNLFEFIAAQGVLSFDSMKVLLTDALFTLIVLAIVKALFVNSGFEYALTFLEISFVVIVRKLILLETVPEENMTLLILGAISTAFFVLIVYIHNLKRQWKNESKLDEAKTDATL
jgi:hypothetical protein